jgi:hypothetical protein
MLDLRTVFVDSHPILPATEVWGARRAASAWNLRADCEERIALVDGQRGDQEEHLAIGR